MCNVVAMIIATLPISLIVILLNFHHHKRIPAMESIRVARMVRLRYGSITS